MWLVRAPDHLGDGVMAIPAVEMLQQHLDLMVIGPKWCTTLYRNVAYGGPKPVAQKATGVVLLKPSFGAAWRHRKHKRRIGLKVNNRGFLLTDPVSKQNCHRMDDYQKIAQTLVSRPVAKIPIFSPVSSFTINPNTILLIVGTASPKTVRRNLFRSLARALPRKNVLFAGGPGDEQAVKSLGDGFPQLPTDLSIDDFGAVAQQAAMVIGLDSGLGHVAAAARAAINKPAHTTKIVYGSTSPRYTGPRNTSPIFDSRPPCWPCYAKRCKIKSASPTTPCLQTPIQEILCTMS